MGREKECRMVLCKGWRACRRPGVSWLSRKDRRRKDQQLGSDFNGRDRYLWLQQKVSVPQAKEDREPVGYFDFGKTGGGTNSGFESLLYVNGHPFQAVDRFDA